MPLTPSESKRIVNIICLTYGEMWARQQSLLHAMAGATGLQVEAIEQQAEEWVRAHFEDMVGEGARRCHSLLRQGGLLDLGLPEAP
jgi:hypothetical protein